MLPQKIALSKPFGYLPSYLPPLHWGREILLGHYRWLHQSPQRWAAPLLCPLAANTTQP